jgi:hypothetical protein
MQPKRWEIRFNISHLHKFLLTEIGLIVTLALSLNTNSLL